MISDVFCKIINGELKTDFVYKDEDFIVIKDINPQAPVHLLLVPVKHFFDIHAMIEADSGLFVPQPKIIKEDKRIIASKILVFIKTLIIPFLISFSFNCSINAKMLASRQG